MGATTGREGAQRPGPHPEDGCGKHLHRLLCDSDLLSPGRGGCLSQHGLPPPAEDGEKAFPGSSHPALGSPDTTAALASPNRVCTPPVTGSSLPREARFPSVDALLREEASSPRTPPSPSPGRGGFSF